MEATSELSQTCGRILAELAVDALDGGARLLVLENAGGGLVPERQAWLAEQLSAFYAALPSRVQLEKVAVGEGWGKDAEQTGGIGLPPDTLRRLAFEPYASRPPQADAIVSFVGEPPAGSRGGTQWAHLPPVVCLSIEGTDVAELMRAGIVAGAVAPRRTAVPAKAADKGDWFDLMYTVVTPKTLSDWAPESGSP